MRLERAASFLLNALWRLRQIDAPSTPARPDDARTEKRPMMRPSKWTAPKGTLAWATEQIHQLLERDENQKRRRLQRAQTQSPEIESEQLAPPAPDPDRFPPGIWQHAPGILPKQVEPDPRYRPPASRAIQRSRRVDSARSGISYPCHRSTTCSGLGGADTGLLPRSGRPIRSAAIVSLDTTTFRRSDPTGRPSGMVGGVAAAFAHKTWCDPTIVIME